MKFCARCDTIFGIHNQRLRYKRIIRLRVSTNRPKWLSTGSVPVDNFFVFWRCETISAKEMQINDEIKAKEIRVVGEDGEQLGIMSSKEAQLLANEQGVDLVEITANANPPVVKIIDWGKYQYQKMKEEAKNRKKAREKQSELKQMKIGLKIGDNDLNIKVRKMRGFLDDGDRVKILIIFRGREMAHKEIGNELLDKVISLLGDDIVVEGKPQMNGRNLSVQVRRK